MSFVRFDSPTVGIAAIPACDAFLLASDLGPRGGCEAPTRADQEDRLEAPWAFGSGGSGLAQGCSWDCTLPKSMSLILTVGSWLHDGRLDMTSLQMTLQWHIQSS